MKKVNLSQFAHLDSTFKQDIQAVIKAIDENVNKGLITLDHSNAPTTGKVSPDRVESQPGLNVATGKVQESFSHAGMSIAICAEDHRYQKAEPVHPLDKLRSSISAAMFNHQDVQALIQNRPDICFSDNFLKKLKDQTAVHAWIQGWFDTYLETVVENLSGVDTVQKLRDLQIDQQYFDHSKLDFERGKQLKLLAEGGTQIPKPDLLILERDLRKYYPAAQDDVHEDELFKEHLGLNYKQRSMVIAAYIFLSLAGGDQSKSDRVLILIGENHLDIFDQLEVMIDGSTAVTWLKSRPRTYLTIPSNVPKKV